MPLVSVLMTCFNREKYIAFAIESVLASSYREFELIILDDCSTDKTLEIAQSFVKQDSRVKAYQNDKNIGDYPNRNRIASYATGKYLKYVDSDDYIYPYGLELMVKTMEDNPVADWGVASLKPDIKQPFPFVLSPKESYRYNFIGPGLFHVGPLSVIFKTVKFNEIGGFSNGRMISDTDMWHRMALIFPVVLMNDGIVWQRRHPEQELSQKDLYAFQGEKIKWQYFLRASEFFSPAEIRNIRNQRSMKYLRYSLASLGKFKFDKALSFLKCLKFILFSKTSEYRSVALNPKHSS